MYDKIYYEKYAYLAIKTIFPDLEMKKCNPPDPDWKDEKKQIGFEVTRGEPQHIGNSKSFANRNLGKNKKEISDKELRSRREFIFFDESDVLRGMTLGTSGLVDSNAYIRYAIHKTKEKLEKLNNNYPECSGGCWLFLFLYSSFINDDKTHLTLYVSEANKLQTKFNNKFNKVFLFANPTIHLIDFENDSHCRYDLTDCQLKSIKISAQD